MGVRCTSRWLLLVLVTAAQLLAGAIAPAAAGSGSHCGAVGVMALDAAAPGDMTHPAPDHCLSAQCPALLIPCPVCAGASMARDIPKDWQMRRTDALSDPGTRLRPPIS